ncbi:hypothetical protein HY492_03075 [Candidatus Woesearchaeota archaeon]|nr:hypothetical protein [Candidatus Woesearchaeota archaeon]
MNVTPKEIEDMIAPQEAYKQLAPLFHVHDREELVELERRVHLLEAHVHMVPANLSPTLKVSWPISVTVVKHDNGVEIRPCYSNQFGTIMPLNVENNPARINHVEQDNVFLSINENNYVIYFREK